MCSIQSAYAPEFFLHHAFIDKIWWEVQQKNEEFFEGLYLFEPGNMAVSPYRAKDVLDLQKQPGHIKVTYDECTINEAVILKSLLAGKQHRRVQNLAKHLRWSVLRK